MVFDVDKVVVIVFWIFVRVRFVFIFYVNLYVVIDVGWNCNWEVDMFMDLIFICVFDVRIVDCIIGVLIGGISCLDL